jgi:hypothetical protein
MILKRGKLSGTPERTNSRYGGTPRGSEALRKYRADKGVGGAGFTNVSAVEHSYKYPPTGHSGFASGHHGSRMLNASNGTADPRGRGHTKTHYGQKRRYDHG